MRCPKCNGEIRIQTDVCPFCGLILPSELKNTYDTEAPKSTFYHTASQILNNEEASYFANGTQNRNSERKNRKTRRQNVGKIYKSDDLPFEARTELDQEIIIMLLFVLIIIGIIQVIVLLKLQ